MFPHFIFISYIVMLFMGLQAILLVIILLKIDTNHNNYDFKAKRNFLLVSLVLGIMYFITYYSDFVIGNFNTSLPYRLIDGMIFYAFGLSWIKVLDRFSKNNYKSLTLRKMTNWIFGLLMIVSSFAYGFLLDELYTTPNPYVNKIIIILELTLVLVVLLFTIIYLTRIDWSTLEKINRRFILFISVVLNTINLWNSLVALSIFLRIMDVSILTTYSYGFTGTFIFVINFYILLYTYKTNYPSIHGKNYPMDNTNIPQDQDKNYLVDKALATLDFKLTERELEVIKLAYDGSTNPEIGEKLSISKHTVKRHMHNIFNKMDVSTRLEMVHLINSAK